MKWSHEEDSGFSKLTVAMDCGFDLMKTNMVMNALFEGTKNDVRSGKRSKTSLHFIFPGRRGQKPHT